MVQIALLIIIGVCIYGYYTTLLSPTCQQSLFRNLKWEYSKVQKGEMAYPIFCSHFRSQYLFYDSSYPKETVTLMYEMNEILNHEKFLQEALADPNITLRAFMSKWLKYHPASEIPSTVSESPKEAPLSPVREIPSVFMTEKAQERLKLMTHFGYLDNNRNWILNPNPKRDGDLKESTYLVALFADALAEDSGLDRRDRWKHIKSLWGDRNYPDLLKKAQESPQFDLLLEKVRMVFPDYSK